MDFEEMIEKFTDEHPVWSWIIARLVICICVCTIVGIGFGALILVVVPFVLISQGAGIGAFAWWFLVPLIAALIWVLCSVVCFVWEGWIE